jgi:hypothetical protein
MSVFKGLVALPYKACDDDDDEEEEEEEEIQ